MHNAQVVYTSAIGWMAVLALSRRPSLRWSYWCGVTGAGLFMLSDTLLALNKFGRLVWLLPPNLAKYIVMSTYYAAQIAIAASAHGAASPAALARVKRAKEQR